VFGDFDHKYLPRQGFSILPTDRACIPTKIVTQKYPGHFGFVLFWVVIYIAFIC